MRGSERAPRVMPLVREGQSKEPAPAYDAGIAIDPGLEACVLECLEKDPSRRPQTARVLGERLAASGGAPWTKDDARARWAARGPRRPAPVPAIGALSESMTVDVASRL